MKDISLDIQNVKKIFGDSLVIGNHDTITLFGIQPQNRLNDYSRKITTLLLKDTAELDRAIVDILTKIEYFELRVKNPVKSFWTYQIYHKELQKEYIKISSYIDSMVLYFKLQQTQLFKEIKFLEKLATMVATCSEELEQYIEIGGKILSEKDITDITDENIFLSLDTSTDMDIWYDRLEKRINDLSVTHAISLQNQVQLKLLRNNDLIMLDKIASTISNTFPIWQNQMALMLGIDLMENRMNSNNKLVSICNRYINQIAKKTLCQKNNKFQADELLELNQSLSKVLSEMVHLEENNVILRKEFLNIVKHTERG